MRGIDEIRERLEGPVSSVPTIFTRDGKIDHDGIRAVIDKSLEGDCQVIMLTCGDSLITLLTDDEVVEVHRTVIDHVGGRAITIACDNMWGQPKCVEFGRYVRDLGFDIYMVRPPMQPKGTPESLAEFYRAAARETRVMLVGDVPIRTCELIADEPNICAFKEDAGLDYALEVLKRWGDRWPMIGGGGQKRHYLLWPHGNCRGWLDVFIYCNLAPARLYWEAVKRNDAAEAWNVIMQYEYPVWQEFLSARVGGDGFVHTMLEACGVAPRWRRSPAADATDEETEQVGQLLCGLGLL